MIAIENNHNLDETYSGKIENSYDSKYGQLKIGKFKCKRLSATHYLIAQIKINHN